MEVKNHSIIVLFFILFLSGSLFSQNPIRHESLIQRDTSEGIINQQRDGFGMQVIPNQTAIALVEELLGDGFDYGINVFNAQLIGSGPANGKFFDAGEAFGMVKGIIFSSGKAIGSIGPNNSGGNTTNPGGSGAGDADLNNIPGVIGTNDASGIVFDFIPETDTIKFQYIFGSEEYPEFVDSYNDVFAFFLSGVNPLGGNYLNENIALIPNTDIAVTINNINNEDYSQYYVDNENSGPNIIQYDGYTVVLTAKALVEPCTQYHIKIVIADDGDSQYDSGVFLKSNSFTAATVEVVPEYANSNIQGSVEGCNDVTLNFNIDARSEPTDIDFEVITGSGQAEYGIDYTTIPPITNFPIGNMVIPASETSITLQIIPIDDGITEDPELFQLIYTHNLGCAGSSTDTVAIQIEDHNDVIIEPFGNTNITCGESTTLSVEVSEGYPNYTYNWSGGLGHFNTVDVYPLQNTSYTVSVNDQCGYNNDYTFNVLVERPIASITGAEEICALEPIE